MSDDPDPAADPDPDITRPTRGNGGRPRTGALFSLADDPALVRLAEDLGYESAWTAEGQGKSAFGKLERWAGATDEIGLATGIVNVFARTPAATAQAAATLDAHSSGRAILGLGVAHPGVVEEFHGAEFDRPLARLAEYVELVRRYLRGDPGAFDGEFFSPSRTRFWDAFAPERAEIPIYNAALGPDNVRLTGKYADGWLPNLYPLDQFHTAREWLAEGAERGGRSPEAVDVAMYVLAAVDEDPTAARDAVAHHVAYYLRDIPGFYDRVAERAGFGDEVTAARDAPSTEDAGAELSDAFLDTVGLWGRTAPVREELAEIRAAGVDLPIVRAPVGADRAAQERLLRAFAPAEAGRSTGAE